MALNRASLNGHNFSSVGPILYTHTYVHTYTHVQIFYSTSSEAESVFMCSRRSERTVLMSRDTSPTNLGSPAYRLSLESTAGGQ